MDVNSLVGREGGKDATWWRILAIEDVGLTTYYPSIKDGVMLTFGDPEYWQHKVTRTRHTIRCTVAGNPVCAEYDLSQECEEKTSSPHSCAKMLACGPHTLDIYPEVADGQD
jgi:hypothetical protein